MSRAIFQTQTKGLAKPGQKRCLKETELGETGKFIKCSCLAKQTSRSGTPECVVANNGHAFPACLQPFQKDSQMLYNLSWHTSHGQTHYTCNLLCQPRDGISNVFEHPGQLTSDNLKREPLRTLIMASPVLPLDEHGTMSTGAICDS